MIVFVDSQKSSLHNCLNVINQLLTHGDGSSGVENGYKHQCLAGQGQQHKHELHSV